MPLVIGAAVRDGLVVAADSRAYGGLNDGPPRVISDHVPRLFQLSRYVAVAYWGRPFISVGGSMVSVSSAIANIIPDCSSTSTLDEAIAAFRRYALARLGGKDLEPFGFMFAGYDERNVGRIVTLDLPGETPTEFCSTEINGITWQGYGRVITRIIMGADPELMNEIGQGKTGEALRERLADLRYVISWPLLSIGDAASIAESLIQITASVQRIAIAVGKPENAKHLHPDVGGPIDIAAVTRSGFHWIQRKKELPAPVRLEA